MSSSFLRSCLFRCLFVLLKMSPIADDAEVSALYEKVRNDAEECNW